MVGRTVRVLFERTGRLPGQMAGKSEYLHAVHVSDSAIAIGDLARVRITASGPNSLAGEVLRPIIRRRRHFPSDPHLCG